MQARIFALFPPPHPHARGGLSHSQGKGNIQEGNSHQGSSQGRESRALSRPRRQEKPEDWAASNLLALLLFSPNPGLPLFLCQIRAPTATDRLVLQEVLGALQRELGPDAWWKGGAAGRSLTQP